jgi:signal transduction histidine kinase
VNKLLLCFLAVAVPPLMVMAVFQYLESSKYLFDMEEKGLSFHANIIAEQVDLYFDQMTNQLLAISMNHEIVDFLRRKDFSEQSVHRLNSFLDRIRGISSEEYSTIFVLDESGVCLASTDDRFINTDYAFRSYAKAIIEDSAAIHTSDFSIGLRSLVPGVFISAPVRGKNGELIGIAVLKIAGTAIWGIAESVDSGGSDDRETGKRDGLGRLVGFLLPRAKDFSSAPEASIVNEDGIIISHPDASLLYHSIDDLHPIVLASIAESRQFLGRDIKSLKNPFLMNLHKKARLSSQTQAATYTFNKEVRVAAISPLKTRPWTIGVSVGYGRFSYLSRLLFLKLLAILLVILLCLFPLSFLTSRLVIKPLEDLICVIGRIRTGERSARVRTARKDEFGILAERFNELHDIINDYSQTLEEKVRRRTREISCLQQENLRLRIIEEKERIYADLHDSIGASLTNILVCNNVARSMIGHDTEAAGEMIEKIDANCATAIHDLREMLRGSGPVSPEGAGPADSLPLRESMASIIEPMRERLSMRGIRLYYHLDPLEDRQSIGQGAFAEMKLICEELVSNVLRHAEASQVVLRLGIGKKSVRLSFSDNGRGFDPRRARGKGMGLRNLSERIRRLGGTLRISSGSPNGSSFSIVLPGRDAV